MIEIDVIKVLVTGNLRTRYQRSFLAASLCDMWMATFWLRHMDFPVCVNMPSLSLPIKTLY